MGNPGGCPEWGTRTDEHQARVRGGLLPGRQQFLHQQVPVEPLGQLPVVAPDLATMAGHERAGLDGLP